MLVAFLSLCLTLAKAMLTLAAKYNSRVSVDHVTSGAYRSGRFTGLGSDMTLSNTEPINEKYRGVSNPVPVLTVV